MVKKKIRSGTRMACDFVTFPLRAVTLFYRDFMGMSSLKSERFDYVLREVKGECLDIGCGRGNIFVKEYLGGRGVGIDVYPYEGLTKRNLVKSLTRFPFKAKSFGTVTFIASLNHCPKADRDVEIKEAYRVLKPSGRVVITMGNPVAELLVHKLVYTYDRFLGTNVDVDSERGMAEGEEYFLSDQEIKVRLVRAGFKNIKKKYFVTQWFLNHMFIAEKI